MELWGVPRCIFGPNPDVASSYAYSVSKRVAAYAVPVIVLSVAVNVPKFLETRVVIERTHDPDTGQNVTNYSFDVTELRSVGRACELGHGRPWPEAALETSPNSEPRGSKAARISIARISRRSTSAKPKSPSVG